MKQKRSRAPTGAKLARRQVMLSEDDAERVDALAAARGQFTSGYLRGVVIEHLERLDAMVANARAAAQRVRA